MANSPSNRDIMETEEHRLIVCYDKLSNYQHIFQQTAPAMCGFCLVEAASSAPMATSKQSYLLFQGSIVWFPILNERPCLLCSVYFYSYYEAAVYLPFAGELWLSCACVTTLIASVSSYEPQQ